MKNKINQLILVVILCLSIVVVLSGMNKTKPTYEQLRNQVFNIINNKDVSYNQIYDNYVYYRPDGFQAKKLPSQVELINNDADILIHFGTNKTVKDKFYTNINQDKKNKCEYIDEDDHYFIIWQYDKTHSLVLIGQNDRYVEGLVDTDKEDEYLIILSQIYASINEMEK